MAREFRDEEAFYFPHSVDFRGRAYPLHPHLNHLGSDVCRGLLQFARAKPLGRDGFNWLLIQACGRGAQPPPPPPPRPPPPLPSPACESERYPVKLGARARQKGMQKRASAARAMDVIGQECERRAASSGSSLNEGHGRLYW